MIKRKIEYSTVTAPDLFTLVRQVGALLGEGWETTGGIAALAMPKNNPDGSIWYEKEYTQAVIRIELPLSDFVNPVLYSEQRDPYAKDSSS
jgi:hypothetical protein